MAENAKGPTIITAIIIILAWIFYVVTNAVPAWGEHIIDGTVYTVGLWAQCKKISERSVCITYTCSEFSYFTGSVCSKLKAARALVTLTCILSGFSAICLLVSLTLSDRPRSIILRVSKILVFTSLVAGITGVAVGINVIMSFSKDAISWGGSSSTGIIAIIINVSGTITSLLLQ